MKGIYKLLIPAALAAASIMAAQQTEQIERGHKGSQSYAFRLLPPASFPELPTAVLADLEKRRCMIPQTYEAHGPENVIHGAFHDKGSSDWAILCSQNGRSTLLVYWNGITTKPAELATQPNIDAADPYDSTHVLGYARGIDAAPPGVINETLANRPQGPFDHDGIQDAHIEKFSIIHYFKNGSWITLSGSE